MSAKLTNLLRGSLKFGLVDGTTELIDPALYPFGSGKLPILCESSEEVTKPFEAFESGFRSIAYEQPGCWLKAKGVGIPRGSSRPIRMGGEIFTYFLNEVDIGGGRIIWGFSTVEEARREFEMTREARSLGCPAPKPVGLGVYHEVKVIDFRDRNELFQTIASTPRGELLGRFSSARRIEAACAFLQQPTDIRIDEILYGFLHPGIEGLLSTREARDFLKWLGSRAAARTLGHTTTRGSYTGPRRRGEDT